SESGPLFGQVAREKKSPIQFADKIFKVLEARVEKNLLRVKLLDRRNNQEEKYELDLTGNYQAKNLLGVLITIEHFVNEGFIIEPEHIRAALKQVCKLTGFAGRWQVIEEKPMVIADTGHNEDGIKKVVENLKNIHYNKLHFVFGTVNDKDVSKILQLLPKEAEYYFVRSSVPRALDENELKSLAQKEKLSGKSFATVKEGLAQ